MLNATASEGRLMPPPGLSLEMLTLSVISDGAFMLTPDLGKKGKSPANAGFALETDGIVCSSPIGRHLDTTQPTLILDPVTTEPPRHSVLRAW